MEKTFDEMYIPHRGHRVFKVTAEKSIEPLKSL